MHAFKNLAKICKYMRIQIETNESLFNDSYRFLKFHMIGVSKKNVLFHTLHKPIYLLKAFESQLYLPKTI
jgi:hypothetical protein